MYLSSSVILSEVLQNGKGPTSSVYMNWLNQIGLNIYSIVGCNQIENSCIKV